ncbi:unnamed protein product [Schistosoma turkestanicum]|nr:unnamed protein product [Schistosoma turkestanicum]
MCHVPLCYLCVFHLLIQASIQYIVDPSQEQTYSINIFTGDKKIVDPSQEQTDGINVLIGDQKEDIKKSIINSKNSDSGLENRIDLLKQDIQEIRIINLLKEDNIIVDPLKEQIHNISKLLDANKEDILKSINNSRTSDWRLENRIDVNCVDLNVKRLGPMAAVKRTIINLERWDTCLSKQYEQYESKPKYDCSTYESRIPHAKVLYNATLYRTVHSVAYNFYLVVRLFRNDIKNQLLKDVSYKSD